MEVAAQVRELDVANAPPAAMKHKSSKSSLSLKTVTSSLSSVTRFKP